MKTTNIPFNIELLQLTPENIRFFKPVTSLDTFEGNTRNYHPEGLYSASIFGTVGSDSRYEKFAYIDLKITVIHPTVFKALVQLKGFYLDIMASREFAIWDPNIKDFIKSNALTGQTGYEFFIEHIHEIDFPERPSDARDQNIKLMRNSKDKMMQSYIAVLPAAYRDMEIDDSGRPSSDEINNFYYKLIAITNTINPNTVKISPSAYNSQRWSIQVTFNELYDYLRAIIEGKKNLLMGKWASRKIFNGTRNVITSMDTTTPVLGVHSNVGINDTAIGLYQCAKAILPITKHQLKIGFLSKVFSSVGAPALLVNKKTLQSERVNLKSEVFDQWMTNEGLDAIISAYKEPSIRHTPIMISGYYLGLIYRGPDKTFKLINSVDEIPEGRSKEDVSPISLTDLLYTSIYHVANKYSVIVTRYPIGQGKQSVYPSKIYLKSTIDFETRYEVDDEWQVTEASKVAYQFPVRGSDLFSALSPNSARLAGLSADFDGDIVITVNENI